MAMVLPDFLRLSEGLRGMHILHVWSVKRAMVRCKIRAYLAFIKSLSTSFGATIMEYQVFNTVMGSFVGAIAILAVVVHIF